MKLRFNYRTLALALALFVCGCATVAPVAPSFLHLSVAQRRQQLMGLENWSVTAAIGIKQNGQSDIAHCTWSQQQNNFNIIIYTPLNLSHIQIIGDNNQVVLYKTNNEKVIARTAEELLYHELGWSLPLTNLKYWIKGLPAPYTAATKKYDNYNHLILLEQQGWKITYTNFTTVTGVDLPTTIMLTAANIQIKIVINQWKL